MNRTAKVLIIAGITFLTGLIIAALGFGFVKNNSKKSVERMKDVEYKEYVYESSKAGKDISYLGITLSADNVDVKIGSSDKIVIRYIDRKDDPEIDITEDNGILTMGYDKEKGFHADTFFNVYDFEAGLNFRNENGYWFERYAKIELPKDASLELFLETVSGNIDMDGVEVGKEFNLKTSSGEVSLSNCIIPKCTRFSTVSGNVSLIKDVFNDGLTVVTSSGDVEFESVRADGDLSVQTVSGDIYFQDVSNQGKLFTDTSSGECKYNSVKTTGDISCESVSGNIKINDMEGFEFKAGTSSGDGEAEKLLITGSAYVSTVSGDVDLDFEMDKASCSQRTSTVSGDVSESDFEGGRQVIEINTSSGDIETSYK